MGAQFRRRLDRRDREAAIGQCGGVAAGSRADIERTA
jgi:hypothetical protein